MKIQRELDKARLAQQNEKLDNLKKTEGVLGERLKQCLSNITNANDQKYSLECSLSDIDKEIREYPNYSNSLLDEEELKCIEELKISVALELKGTAEAINNNKEEKIRANGNINNTEIIIGERKRQLSEKNEWVESYRNSLKEIRIKTSAEESNIEENCGKLKKQVESHASRSSDINKSIDKIDDEIKILEDYGFLRARSKYDALNSIKGEWKYAKFGSDILKELDEDKSKKILDRFPGFAEVLIVADDDYKRVSEGKKAVSITVAQENLVLMPWSAIKKFEEEIQFASLFMLTRDGEYYRNLLNSEEAIESRRKEINKLSEKQATLSSEKEMIEMQIALLSAHIYKYPLQTVEKYLESVSKLEKEISALTAEKLQHEQNIRTLELKAEALKDKFQKLEKENMEVNEKQQLFISKMKLTSEISEIATRTKDFIDDKSNLEYKIDNNNAELNLALKEKDHLENAIERIKENIRLYCGYVEGSEGYKDESFGILEESDIANLYSKFLVAKHAFDEKAQNYEELVGRQAKLNKLMEDIRKDHKFAQIDFLEVYALNYVHRVAPEEFRVIDLKIEDFNKTKSRFEEERNNIKAEIIACERDYEKLKNKITVYFDKFKALNIQQLYSLESESNTELLKINYQIETIKKAINDITAGINLYTNELGQFKVFCQTNDLNWQTAIKSELILTYSEMQKNYAKVKTEYDKAISRINAEIKKLYAILHKLIINEQLKLKLKEYLTNKRTFEETILLVKLLSQTSDSINTTIRNIEISIENIGHLDAEIAEQVFRMLKTILDEIAKIPEYSKFKYGDYTKESFKINLSDENSCRIDNDTTLSRLKAYVYELAYSAQNDGMTKKEIKNRLSINNIIQYGIDFDKLNIQILKIEQEKPKYYSWGRLSASSGQSYVTYVMFAITMVKYFNNVTVLNDKMKAPIFIFLDNPFSSASSIELWEPVRRFLDKSNAQLLCVAHNVPSSAQILFDKHMIIEQTKNAKGQFINTIRNEKTESKEIIQMRLFDHLEID